MNSRNGSRRIKWLKKNQKPNTVKINIKRTADRLIDLLTAHNLSDKDLGKINFEFILVKADLGYLDKVNNVNEEALKGYMYSDMGLEPLIQTVETKFKKIGYSVYSANKKYSGYPYITTNLIERITTELGIAPLEKQLRNLDSFVDKVEADAESYTDEDWESLNSEFEAMISEIEENSENMTEEEKEQALNAIGKYYGICAKKGMETVVEGGKKGHRFPDTVPQRFL